MSLECAAVCVGCARIFANVVDLVGAALQCLCILPMWILYTLALPFCACYERVRGTNGSNGSKRDDRMYTNPMRSDSVSSVSSASTVSTVSIESTDDEDEDEGFYTARSIPVGKDKLRLW